MAQLVTRYPVVWFVIRRLALAALTIVLVSVIIFAGTEILPGDAATALLGPLAAPDALEALRTALGLHEPAPLRYWHWLSGFVTGNLGASLANQTPIAPELWLRARDSFLLAGVSSLVAVPLSLAFGIASAVWRHGWFDRLVNAGSLAAISLPEFFICYVLILLFAVRLDWLPSLAALSPDMGFVATLQAIALPVATLSLAVGAYIIRMTRAALLSTLAQPYIEMAVLKGVPPWRVMLLHALPNALAPIIQVVAYNLAYMVVGVVLVEVVFVYPGIGQYLVNAVASRDVPVVQACGLIFGVTYVGLNAAADILTVLTNPRLRRPQ